MKRKIVFITDCSDIAYNELRGVTLRALAENAEGENIEIEPAVIVKPFSLINGSFILRLMAEVYPPETIFSVILNPMKDRPARIFGKTQKDNFIFLGANTGVFEWLLKDFGLDQLYELNDPGFVSFGGKYVHAPNVARLATGVPFGHLGKPFDAKKLLSLNLERGTIVHIDNFGLIKFIGPLPDAREGDRFKIEAGNKDFIAKYARRMMSEEAGEWVIYPGSSLGLPELGRVRQNGAMELNVDIGEKIFFEKI